MSVRPSAAARRRSSACSDGSRLQRRSFHMHKHIIVRTLASSATNFALSPAARLRQHARVRSPAAASRPSTGVPWRDDVRKHRRPLPPSAPPDGHARPREGHEARARRPRPHRVGRAQHAGAARDPRPLRQGEAAQEAAHRGLPARDHRDREPHAHAEGRRRRGVPVRLQPAQHAGRRGRRAGRALRHPDVRDQGRGPQDLLLAHRLAASRPARTSRWTTAATWSRCCTPR